jgi:predicted HTH domain antitoxin
MSDRTTTLQIDVPEDALDELAMSPADLHQEVRLMLAARLYGSGRASTGRAAEMMGVPRTLLLSRLGSFGVSLVELTEEELREDFEHARRGQ